MHHETTFTCKNLSETRAAGEKLAGLLPFPAVVYLDGDMGVGKTTLSQAIVQALGYRGAVTSPTYNLVHEYAVDDGMVYHLDLYRLDDPEEIEYLAIEDMLTDDSLLLIEWPERGLGHIPGASHIITIEKQDSDSGTLRSIRFRETRET